MQANNSTYEPYKNKIPFDYPTIILPKDHIGHGAPNYDSVTENNSFSHGTPKI